MTGTTIMTPTQTTAATMMTTANRGSRARLALDRGGSGGGGGGPRGGGAGAGGEGGLPLAGGGGDGAAGGGLGVRGVGGGSATNAILAAWRARESGRPALPARRRSSPRPRGQGGRGRRPRRAPAARPRPP